MADAGGTVECGNCGKDPGVTLCVDVWREPHTHPAGYPDLTPVPCSLVLCRRCATMVERNLVAQTGRPSTASYPPCPHCGSSLRPGVSVCPVCGPHAHGRPSGLDNSQSGRQDYEVTDITEADSEAALAAAVARLTNRQSGRGEVTDG